MNTMFGLFNGTTHRTEKWLIKWSLNGMKRDLIVESFCKSEALDSAKRELPAKAKINKIQQL